MQGGQKQRRLCARQRVGNREGGGEWEAEASGGLPALRVEDSCYDAGQSKTAQVACGTVSGEQGRRRRVGSGGE
jgi:hypothetical protein